MGIAKHDCVVFQQNNVQIPEESAGCPQHTKRSAHAMTATKPTTNTTIFKVVAPKAIGLPKPPQISPKVSVCMSMSFYSQMSEELVATSGNSYRA